MKHNFLHTYNVLPADRIIVPKSDFQIVQHHAIYLGYDVNGVDWIVENKIGFGVRLITANDFFSDVRHVTEIKRFEGTPYERKQAVQLALQKVGRPYDLINYNCQHFASEVQTGEQKSDQVDAFFEGARVVGGTVLVLGLLTWLFNED